MLDRGVQQLLGFTDRQVNQAIVPVRSVPEISRGTGLDYIFADFKKKYPDAKAYHFYFPNDTSSTVTVLTRYDPVLKTVVTRYHTVSGQLLYTSAFEGKRIGEKFSAMNYDIHTGSILGLPAYGIVNHIIKSDFSDVLSRSTLTNPTLIISKYCNVI